MTRSLDLGCGPAPRNPFHAEEVRGIDVIGNPPAHVCAADLAIEPIPYGGDVFDFVTAFDFLEHVPRVVYAPHRRNAFVELMNEIHRVLKPGGLFYSLTPAYPHNEAFRDPTHVNVLTEETFPQYFDDQLRWASLYGFRGAFRVRKQRWVGPHIAAVLQKVPAPDAPAPASPDTRRISVVLPVHNGERFLSRTLDSVLAQTDSDFEVLCIDDASTDGSDKVLREYAARDPRIRVITAPRRLGSAPKALNHALPQMTGAYFVYSSQDDLFSPDWLAKMRARAVETGADAVLPDVVIFHEGAPEKNTVLGRLAGDRDAVISGREACLRSLDWSIPGNALWSARLVRTLGFEEFAVDSDEYSFRRFLLECNKVAFCGGRYFSRQDNPGAVTRLCPASFEWPFTRLRVAELLSQYDLGPEVVRRELDGARSAMRSLHRRLEEQWANEWDSQDVALAHAAISRFEQRFRLKPVLPWPRDPGWQPRLSRGVAKGMRALRKLPKKLGLR